MSTRVKNCRLIFSLRLCLSVDHGNTLIQPRIFAHPPNTTEPSSPYLPSKRRKTTTPIAPAITTPKSNPTSTPQHTPRRRTSLATTTPFDAPMSPKLQAKNLSYDATLPPFLQRLRALNSATDGRHERPLARPKRARAAEEEDEDAPVYVDERGVEVRVEDVRGKMREEDGRTEGEGERITEERTAEGGRMEEKMAVIGAARRRKVGRVVGAVEEGRDRDGAGEMAEAEKSKGPDGPLKVKKKKMVKKVKLSFGDDE